MITTRSFDFKIYIRFLCTLLEEFGNISYCFWSADAPEHFESKSLVQNFHQEFLF